MTVSHPRNSHGRGDTQHMEVSPEEFRIIAALVQERFGIFLADSKRAMLSSRMFKLVRASGCDSFASFYQEHLKNPSNEVLSLLANAVSTNHTYFNRESSHFWYFRDQVLPELIKSQKAKNERDIRVWCAASSSGEEPYTLAMVIRDALSTQSGNWKGGLLATDISQDVLATALRGVYPEDGADTLPEPMFRKYFRPAGPGQVEVIPELKNDVTFRRFNLMNERYPFRQPFHVVFCRNVMIYFEEDTKRKVVQRIYDVTAPGGYLFVGHAETISSLGTRFKTIQPGIYRKM